MALSSQSFLTRGPKWKDFFPVRSFRSSLHFVCAVVLCTILLSWTANIFPSTSFMAAAMNVRSEDRSLPPEGRFTRGMKEDHPLLAHPPLSHTIPEITRVAGCAMNSHSMPEDLQHKSSTPSLSFSGSFPLSCFVPRMPKEENHSSTTPPPALTLAFRGLNFPFSSPTFSDDEWSVELLESEFSSGVDSSTPSEREARTSDAISSQRHLSCSPVVPSTLFPSQLFTCVVASLPSSFFSSSRAFSPPSSTSTSSNTGSSVWMDVFLVRRPSSAVSSMGKEKSGSEEKEPTDANREREVKKREAWEVVAVRRAAVKLIDGDTAEDKKSSSHSRHRTLVGAHEHGAQSSHTPHDDDYHTVEKQEDRASKESGAGNGIFSSLHSTSPLERLEEVYRGGDHIWTEFGVGGLHTTLHTLLRRVFLSRFPSLHDVVHSLSLEPVRGVILHGPSGTGKTLIARTLIDILGPSAHVTIVHSTDILSKFVGESEQKLEHLFTQSMPAPWEVEEEEEEEKEEEAGGASPDWSTASARMQHHSSKKKGMHDAYFPHVIMIDELETLFVRRNGNKDGSSAGWLYESVTNTLLSLMDGLSTQRVTHPSGAGSSVYHNVLVIGITNRVEVLDPALLRPGRFEVVIEIPSPDRDALEEIFMIHTAELQQHGFLASDVVSSEMAYRMSGFTGAEVAGVTRAAVSVAMESHVKETNARTRWNRTGRKDEEEKKEDARFLVRREHFLKSIAEIRHSAAREEDPYHSWAPPLMPSLHSSSSSSTAASFPLVGGLPIRRSLTHPPSQALNRTRSPPPMAVISHPAFVVDYSGHLFARLQAVEDFWYSLHPLSSLSSSFDVDGSQRVAEDTTAESSSSLFFPPTGGAGVVAVEGAGGNGKTAVLRYLHDRFRRAALLATDVSPTISASSSSSSSSLFHSRYLDCQSVLAWSKHQSIEEMTNNVEEWLKRAENLVRGDGPDTLRTPSASLARSPVPPRHVVVMVDGFDHLLAVLHPYPTLESSLRQAMYHFVASCRQGVLSSAYPTSNLLLLTSSRSITSLLPELHPDRIVTLPLLSRVDLQKRVLPAFLITPTLEEEKKEEEERRKKKEVEQILLHDSDTKKESRKQSEGSDMVHQPATFTSSASHSTASPVLSSIVARSYPSSVTFTTFLQLTEKALRQSIATLVDERVDRTEREDEPPAPPPPSASSSSSTSSQKETLKNVVLIRWPRSGATSASATREHKEDRPRDETTDDEDVLERDTVAICNRESAAFFAQKMLSVSAEMGLLYG